MCMGKKLNGVEEKVKELMQRMEGVENELQAKNEEIENLQNQLKKKGLRDLPFEIVCAYQHVWRATASTVTYDRISVEFNNSDQPGGLFVQSYSHTVLTQSVSQVPTVR